MKIVIQRVLHATVEVDSQIIASIGAGVLVFIGVTHTDTSEHATWLANKLVNLRLFADSQGKVNQSLFDRKGDVCIVSQFTLYANCTAGRRPSFTEAAPPQLAKKLYEEFVDQVKRGGLAVQTGIFGADMKIALVNDGPVTLILER